MSNSIAITVYTRPVPQGSMKGFVAPGKNRGKPRAILTSDNRAMKPYRQEVALTAIAEMSKLGVDGPFAEKHVPVAVELRFYFRRPVSVSKKRVHVVVKPDIDKIVRSTFDSLKGIFWNDDAQIVSLFTYKAYCHRERVEINVSKMAVIS